MKAVLYKLETCVADQEDTLHVICSSKERDMFSVMYVDSLVFKDLQQAFEKNKDKKAPESYQSMHWSYVKDVWNKLGFDPVSIVFDAHDGVLFPSITLKQSYVATKSAFVTTFFPIGDSVLASKYLGIPIYFTNSAESVVKKFELSKLSQYIEDVTKGM
jgi:hypothetical protein